VDRSGTPYYLKQYINYNRKILGLSDLDWLDWSGSKAKSTPLHSNKITELSAHTRP
jgi:hypothetical protein